MLNREGNRLTGKARALLLDDGTVWSRICRRDLLERNHLEFRSEMTFGENVYFVWTCLCCADRIVQIPDVLYHYRRDRAGSQTNSGDRRGFAYFKTVEGIGRFVAERGMTELIPWLNHLRLSYLCFGYERLSDELKGEYYDEFSRAVCREAAKGYPVAYPALFSGDLMYDLRYLVLRILHPVTLRILRHTGDKARRRFERVVRFRKWLGDLPLRLKQK